MKNFIFVIVFFAFILNLNGVGCFAEDYIVGSDDILEINVYDHPDLSVKIRVSGDGKVRFPLIGEFLITGMTPSQISELVENKLKDGYIVNPQVSVSMSEYRSRKATILGQVEKPALYELRGKTSLLELISKAEGLTSEAGQYAYITRSEFHVDENKKEKVIEIDLKKLVEKGDTSQNIQIRSQDSIFIPKMKKFYVSGEVKKPSSYKFEEDLSVIKAITNAGGLTDKAAPKNVRIIREIDGKKTILEKVSMDEIIHAEDVIVVPESFF